MKLRIKGNSLRLRVTRSDVTRLIETGHIEETIYFGPSEDARLTYALEHGPNLIGPTLRYRPAEVVIILPKEEATTWAGSNQVGVYGTVNLGPRALDLIVEKDFACLDLSDADNLDTFPNPDTASICP